MTQSNETNSTPGNSPSSKQLWIGGGLAAIVAAGVLVFAVLPAEFGIDLTGSGDASGLNSMAEMGEMTELERGALRENVLFLSADTKLLDDSWTYDLEPFDSIEFKYTMPEGAPLAFSWEGTAELAYDMHGHPFEGGEDMTESFGVDKAQKMEGVYIAPFTGIHGWYWQNRTLDIVTVTLNARGGFTHSTIFGGPAPYERPIEGAEQSVEGAAAGHEMQSSSTE